ncbi:hypothetical protein GCM10010429_55560 [Micromonospora olivasterospora]
MTGGPRPGDVAPSPVAPGSQPTVSGALAPVRGEPSARLAVGSLVVRCLLLGIVAVFLVLPYVGVDSPPRDFTYRFEARGLPSSGGR